MNIRTVGDLRAYLGASGSSATSFSRRLFKDTGCGASVSFRPVNGEWRHNGDTTQFPDDTPLAEVILSTIVEDTDAAWSITLPSGATEAEYDQAIANLESYAEEVWMEIDAQKEIDAQPRMWRP